MDNKEKFEKNLIFGMVVSIILFFVLYYFRVDKQNYLLDSTVSLIINIISSLLLMFLIDRRLKKREAEEKEKQKVIMCKKLSIAIRKFDNFIINTYKESSSITYKSIRYNINNSNKIIDRINFLNLEAKGYKSNLSNIEDMSWRLIIINNLIFYLKSVENFYDNNAFVFESNEMENVSKLIKYLVVINIGTSIINNNSKYDRTEDFTKSLFLEEILKLTFRIKDDLNNYIEEDYFVKKIK